MQVESIWIPYIIFKNTDTDEAVTLETPTLVSVTRQGTFTRSGAEVPDEVIAMLLFFQEIIITPRLRYSEERRTLLP